MVFLLGGLVVMGMMGAGMVKTLGLWLI